MGQEVQREGWAGMRAGTLVLDLKIGRGRLLQQGGQGHTPARSIWCRGETFTECVGICVCVGKTEPVRWSENRKNNV